MKKSKPTDAQEILRILSVLLAGPTNRFGKLETYNAPAEREALRLMAVRYAVGPSDSILDQAAKVCAAVLKEASP